jgi:hypothetical protein
VKRLPPYDVVVPISQMAVFNGARKRERKAFLELFDRLAANPFQESDWTADDSTGRTHYRLVVARHLVTYWADHAAREVRIVSLEQVV